MRGNTQAHTCIRQIRSPLKYVSKTRIEPNNIGQYINIRPIFMSVKIKRVLSRSMKVVPLRMYLKCDLPVSGMMFSLQSSRVPQGERPMMEVQWGESQMDRVKRIWYLSPMRAAKVQAILRSLARTFTARSYKQWIKRNLQTESQIPGPSEWLGMRSWNLSWRNARRHKFAWRGSYDRWLSGSPRSSSMPKNHKIIYWRFLNVLIQNVLLSKNV